MHTKSKSFRVLVVDDKKTVLQAIEDWVEKKVLIGDEEFQIELLPLHVEVIENEGKYEFSEATLERLYDLCQKSFHLMLLDFGFVKEGMSAVDEIFSRQEKHPEKTVRQIVDEVVLNPAHLVNRSKEEYKFFSRIKKSFIAHKGSLIVYTFLPNKIERYYTSADVRENITNAHFTNAKIKVIDTRKELFNNSQFDSIPKDVKEYYPFLIAKYLSKIIQLEIAESMIENTKETRSDLKKLKRNNRIITISTIVTSLITGFLLPSLSDSIQKGDYKVALILFTTMSLTIIIFTVGNKVLENFNESISH